MMKKIIRKKRRNVRHERLRTKLRGTSAVPRLSVFKSSKHIYAQIIDDVEERTMLSISTLTPKIREEIKQDKKKKTEISKVVGKHLGMDALSIGIKRVRFDRGGYPYHGRIKFLAEAAREAGLEF